MHDCATILPKNNKQYVNAIAYMHEGNHSILHKFKLSNLIKNLSERGSTEMRITENEFGCRGFPTNKLLHHINNRLARKSRC